MYDIQHYLYGRSDSFEDSEDEFDPRTDRSIGPMTKRLKMLYTALLQARRDAKEGSAQEGVCGLSLFYKITQIRGIFISAVRDEFNLWRDACPPIGVRRGFLIVIPLHAKKRPCPLLTVADEIGSSPDNFSCN